MNQILVVRWLLRWFEYLYSIQMDTNRPKEMYNNVCHKQRIQRMMIITLCMKYISKMYTYKIKCNNNEMPLIIIYIPTCLQSIRHFRCEFVLSCEITIFYCGTRSGASHSTIPNSTHPFTNTVQVPMTSNNYVLFQFI